MAHILTDPVTLALLWDYGQLCAICEETLWTQRARWSPALVCSDCAETEPEPEPEAEDEDTP